MDGRESPPALINAGLHEEQGQDGDTEVSEVTVTMSAFTPKLCLSDASAQMCPTRTGASVFACVDECVHQHMKPVLYTTFD